MEIQVHTDGHIESNQALIQETRDLLQNKLRRFDSQITRLEVHFSDDSSAAKSGGDDKRCQIEARLAGMQPMSVSDRSGTVPHALSGAVRKLQSLLDRVHGKLDNR